MYSIWWLFSQSQKLTGTISNKRVHWQTHTQKFAEEFLMHAHGKLYLHKSLQLHTTHVVYSQEQWVQKHNSNSNSDHNCSFIRSFQTTNSSDDSINNYFKFNFFTQSFFKHKPRKKYSFLSNFIKLLYESGFLVMHILVFFCVSFLCLFTDWRLYYVNSIKWMLKCSCMKQFFFCIPMKQSLNELKLNRKTKKNKNWTVNNR